RSTPRAPRLFWGRDARRWLFLWRGPIRSERTAHARHLLSLLEVPPLARTLQRVHRGRPRQIHGDRDPRPQVAHRFASGEARLLHGMRLEPPLRRRCVSQNRNRRRLTRRADRHPREEPYLRWLEGRLLRGPGRPAPLRFV